MSLATHPRTSDQQPKDHDGLAQLQDDDAAAQAFRQRRREQREAGVEQVAGAAAIDEAINLPVVLENALSCLRGRTPPARSNRRFAASPRRKAALLTARLWAVCRRKRPCRYNATGPDPNRDAGSMDPNDLELLSDSSNPYRHIITLAFAEHGPAQRGFAADDLNQLSAAEQLHASAIRAEKKLLLLVVGIDQQYQRAKLYAFAGVIGSRAELAPIGDRLSDGFRATSLAGGQVGRFEAQCVVLVFGDVFLMSRRFMGRSRGLFDLQQIVDQLRQHLLPQQEFIHD